MTNYEMVKQFHIAYDQARPDHLTLQDARTRALRLSLIDEEAKEIREAIELGDLDNLAKELADLLYVVYGAGVTFGIDLDKVFAEVHRSNMSKLGDDGKPIYREDGKVLKGPNYTPANVTRVLHGE